MYRVTVNGIKVECDTTSEIKELLGQKQRKAHTRIVAKDRKEHLVYDVKSDKIYCPQTGKRAPYFKKSYTQTQLNKIAACTKTSQLAELAKDFGRTTAALCAQWYELKD